jgi:hypothetical protein
VFCCIVPGISTAPLSESMVKGLWIATCSAWSPQTRIVAPGDAASTAS